MASARRRWTDGEMTPTPLPSTATVMPPARTAASWAVAIDAQGQARYHARRRRHQGIADPRRGHPAVARSGGASRPRRRLASSCRRRRVAEHEQDGRRQVDPGQPLRVRPGRRGSRPGVPSSLIRRGDRRRPLGGLHDLLGDHVADGQVRPALVADGVDRAACRRAAARRSASPPHQGPRAPCRSAPAGWRRPPARARRRWPAPPTRHARPGLMVLARSCAQRRRTVAGSAGRRRRHRRRPVRRCRRRASGRQRADRARRLRPDTRRPRPGVPRATTSSPARSAMVRATRSSRSVPRPLEPSASASSTTRRRAAAGQAAGRAQGTAGAGAR